MFAPYEKLTPEIARQLLDYDPKTGIFTWRARALRAGLERIDKGWNRRFAGKAAKPRYHRHGHSQIGIYCRNYMAHRIAWMHFYGVEPSGDLDHSNGNPSDNRIENLREATRSQNLYNARRRSDNTSGRKGVYWSKGRWQSFITVNGKAKYLGRFETFAGACIVRECAEVQYHGEFARAA